MWRVGGRAGAPSTSLSSTNGPSSSPRCSSSAGASASTTPSISAAAGGEVVSAAAGGSGQEAHKQGQRCGGRTLITRYESAHAHWGQLTSASRCDRSPTYAHDVDTISIAALGASLRPADDASFNVVSDIIVRNVFEDPGRAAIRQSLSLASSRKTNLHTPLPMPHRQRQK